MAERRQPLNLFHLAFVFFSATALAASDFSWHMSAPDGDCVPALSADGKSVTAKTVFPGSVRIGRTADRQTFRHDRAQFDAARLAFDVTIRGANSGLVKAWIYVKNKDGDWFQTEQEFHPVPGEKTTLSVRLDEPGANLLPSGHSMAWNAQEAAGIFETGVSLYSEAEFPAEIEVSEPRFEGKRQRPPLRIVTWNLPGRTAKFRMFESGFTLSREYFNPFDPEEIEVDYEIEVPGNKSGQVPDWKLLCADPDAAPYLPKPAGQLSTEDVPFRYPAFFAQNFTLRNHFTREIVTPSGAPQWFFRALPRTEGPMRIRLRATDHTGTEPETVVTPWRTVEVLPSDERGPVRVSPRNGRYFEFTNGEFFYPVSLNIHTNTDRRSESQFRWEELPDRGLADYEDYFNAGGGAGISLIEVWMASWTFALEWDSARERFFGVGRYNLKNAWKLDRLFDTAKRNGILLNLVFAPHGELSRYSDQEWEDNPFNGKGRFAKANGGFLEKPEDFWANFEVNRQTYRRNRYIAARWGANPNLFAWELWSEVDLTENGHRNLSTGVMGLWHGQAANDLKKMDAGGHMISTHVCGDAGNTLGWRFLTMDSPWLTHVVGDAYRSPDVSYPDQVRRQTSLLSVVEKPILVTEYGGTSSGSADPALLADVHAGLWSTIFQKQAGSSALWWHDFVHFNNLYPHYNAFARFIRGMDLASGPLFFAETRTPYRGFFSERASSPEEIMQDLRSSGAMLHPGFSSAPWNISEPVIQTLMLSVGNDFAAGWIYLPEKMIRYPAQPEDFPAAVKPREKPDAPKPPPPPPDTLVEGAAFRFALPLAPGKYRLVYYNTLTGNPVSETEVELPGMESYLPLPPFRCDVAFKLFSLENLKK